MSPWKGHLLQVITVVVMPAWWFLCNNLECEFKIRLNHEYYVGHCNFYKSLRIRKNCIAYLVNFVIVRHVMFNWTSPTSNCSQDLWNAYNPFVQVESWPLCCHLYGFNKKWFFVVNISLPIKERSVSVHSPGMDHLSRDFDGEIN